MGHGLVTRAAQGAAVARRPGQAGVHIAAQSVLVVLHVVRVDLGPADRGVHSRIENDAASPSGEEIQVGGAQVGAVGDAEVVQLRVAHHASHDIHVAGRGGGIHVVENLGGRGVLGAIGGYGGAPALEGRGVRGLSVRPRGEIILVGGPVIGILALDGRGVGGLLVIDAALLNGGGVAVARVLARAGQRLGLPDAAR